VGDSAYFIESDWNRFDIDHWHSPSNDFKFMLVKPSFVDSSA
jgi:hypothetical protein